jgi:prepilin-type N-terminal cleavage/methylation domain-containing protein
MRRKLGFTLIELIVTLAVMASVSILILPALFGRSHQEQRLIESTDQLADVLRTARQRAMDTASPVCVNIVHGSANYRCYVVRDQSISHVAALPMGVTVHALRKDGDGHLVTDTIFREDGTATANEIEVRGPKGSKKVIVERLTGQVVVEDLTQ